MFKIGEFSNIAQVSIRLLRYYDKIDLLKPAHIDKFSGYRYYTIDQLPRLNRILAFKELGLSLEQIAHLLDDQLSAEELRDILGQKKDEIRRYIQTEQARLNQLEQRLSYIEQEGTLPEHEVILKQVPARQVMSLREHISNFDSMIPLFYTLTQVLRENGISPSAEPALAIYHDVEIPGLSAEVEIAIPVERTRLEQIALSHNRRIARGQLNGVPKMASTFHQGNYTARIIAYVSAARWMEYNHHRLIGPIREIFHRYDGIDNLVEVQFPVQEE